MNGTVVVNRPRAVLRQVLLKDIGINRACRREDKVHTCLAANLLTENISYVADTEKQVLRLALFVVVVHLSLITARFSVYNNVVFHTEYLLFVKNFDEVTELC